MLLARFLMEEKGLTKKALSDACGIDLPSLDALLMGIACPTSDQASSIADALGYEKDLDALFLPFRGRP